MSSDCRLVRDSCCLFCPALHNALRDFSIYPSLIRRLNRARKNGIRLVLVLVQVPYIREARAREAAASLRKAIRPSLRKAIRPRRRRNVTRDATIGATRGSRVGLKLQRILTRLKSFQQAVQLPSRALFLVTDDVLVRR